jgi:hypothetical protein
VGTKVLKLFSPGDVTIVVGYVGTAVLKLFSSGRCDNSGGYVGTQVLKLFSSGRCDNSGGSWVQGIQTITNKITITIIR